MFTALKRLTSTKSDVNGTPPTQPGFHAMSVSLQKKFSKGVQYNMKIILKGDRNCGKSCLFRRLQGLPFVEEYTQTEEIQAANIQWNYKTTDDIVKVEVWDVVDVAKKKKNLPNKLKIENIHVKNNDAEDDIDYCLDASFLDVYKNTNGVIFVFDITKNWTFDYVKREVATVPLHIPILILGNHRDMGHHRAIATDTVHYFIEGLNRDDGSAEIRYAESSMRNGFGLKFIHRFFNLPFLQLQRETLLKQLRTNREEHDVTVQELDLYADSDDSNYDLFIQSLSQKRRQVADANASATPKISIEEAQNKAKLIASKSRVTNESATDSRPVLPQGLEPSLGSTTTVDVSRSISPSNIKPLDNRQNQGTIPGPSLLQTLPSKPANDGIKASSLVVDPAAGVDVDDFVPEGSNQGIDKSFFLEDSKSSGQIRSGIVNKDLHFSSEDENEKDTSDVVSANPLVTSFVEDVVPEFYSSPNPVVFGKTESPGKIVNNSSGAPPNASKFCILSSSEEELSVEKEACINNSQVSASNLDVDLGIFLKDNENAPSEFTSSSATKSHENGDAKEKKSAKKSSSSVSSKHHKKSKHKKSSGSSKKDKHQRDLDDFLNGPSVDDSSHKPDVDLNAYEAL